MCNFIQRYIFLFKCIISLFSVNHNLCFLEVRWNDSWCRKLKERESRGPQLGSKTMSGKQRRSVPSEGAGMHMSKRSQIVSSQYQATKGNLL